MKQKPSCERCKFYQEGAKFSGTCRINPPTVFKGEISSYSHWPPIDSADDWCGKFEAARP